MHGLVETEFQLARIQDYEPFIGPETVERILRKAQRLRGLCALHVNSTYYGGGVAELLGSLTLLLSTLGIKADWRAIQGPPDFFGVTKKMHNALHGAPIRWNERKKKIYEWTLYENSLRMRADADLVVIHDPQPLGLIGHFEKKAPWVWRCHIDMTAPNRELWGYLRGFVERYDAVVFSLEEYAQKLGPPQFFSMPAINPFSIKNRPMTEKETSERLAHYGIPADKPLVVQISRFDRWKDPRGVIEAFKLARREVEARLVLLGNTAADDPEGKEIFESLLSEQDDSIRVLSYDDTALVNALQRRAAVVLQKSTREGFGLTVTEALWKGAAVIGGNTGGIRHQIRDGENGFLVSSAEEAAARIVELVRDPELRRRLGARGRDAVARHFLMSRLAEESLDLLARLLGK